MKKKLISIVLFVAIMIPVCAFGASAVEDDIMLLSSAVYWGPTTITTTSQWVTSGYKSDTTAADVFFSKSSYPGASKIEVRIYDYTAGRVASKWKTCGVKNSGNYYKITLKYDNYPVVSGHTYVLNLRWNGYSSVSSATISGVFYP